MSGVDPIAALKGGTFTTAEGGAGTEWELWLSVMQQFRPEWSSTSSGLETEVSLDIRGAC